MNCKIVAKAPVNPTEDLDKVIAAYPMSSTMMTF